MKGSPSGEHNGRIVSILDNRLEAGRAAAKLNAWREAFDNLSAVDTSEGLEPQDLESLALAAACLGQLDSCIDARERAYTDYVEAGDRPRAAFMALQLRENYEYQKMAGSISAGWLSRAERLLADEPECVEQGWLALAHDDAERALEIGRRFEDRDLEAWSLTSRGRTLVFGGQVAEGLALIDEACAAIAAGELSPYWACEIYCGTMSTCHDLADYARAREWSEVSNRWLERQEASVFPGMCRFHQVEIKHVQGAWSEAEVAARLVLDEMSDFEPFIAGLASRELGEIRLSRGDLEGAAAAFRQAHEVGVQPQPGLALLQLAEGKVESAAASIARALGDAEYWTRLDRARYLLPAQAEIAIVAGDLATARSAAEELGALVGDYATPALQASAAYTLGAVQLAEGDATGAAANARRAQKLWIEVDSPYEAARSQLLLGEAYRAEGDDEAAALELESARSKFESLGAMPDARRASELLVSTQGVGRAFAQRAERTLMFTDIVGSTTLIEAIGDEAWEQLGRWHDESLRRCFAEHGGEEIDHAGDGFFVSFDDPVSAIDCAVNIQRRLDEHRRSHGFAPQIRIGLHSAEATRSGTQIIGKGVHTAARIGALAEGGEILVSRSTVEAAGSTLPTSNAREATLKGISEPVSIVAIDWR